MRRCGVANHGAGCDFSAPCEVAAGARSCAGVMVSRPRDRGGSCGLDCVSRLGARKYRGCDEISSLAATAVFYGVRAREAALAARGHVGSGGGRRVAWRGVQFISSVQTGCVSGGAPAALPKLAACWCEPGYRRCIREFRHGGVDSAVREPRVGACSSACSVPGAYLNGCNRSSVARSCSWAQGQG